MNDLYTSHGDVEGDQWLENSIFQVIDSRAAPVLQKMVNGSSQEGLSLSVDERSSWTVFLRSLFHRTPENLKGTLSQGMAIYDEALESSREDYARLRSVDDPKTFDEYRDSLSIAEKRRSALKSLPSLMTNPRIGNYFNTMPSQIFTINDSAHDLLISDDPMARTNGLLKDDGHIAIPISPRKLFVSANKVDFLRYLANLDSSEMVGLMNQWAVESARYFVVARDKRQDRFIRNRFGASPKPPLMDVKPDSS